jgi:diguanylate cyclase (GGDEF)-like protein/PAS domain S-box-containing protein
VIQQPRSFGRRDFDLSRDLLAIVDFDGYFKEWNPALEEALGYERHELVGKRAFDCVHRDDWDRTLEEGRRLIAGGHETRHFENRYRTKDGRWIWLEWTARAAVHEGLVYGSARDITARKRREEELERAAHVDPLTGLANRRGFERALERELAAAKRHSLCPALVVVDLDNFKSINDTHGHRAGDELLVTTAKTLEQTLRASDMAARIGGDEFAILLPNSDVSTAQLVAEKIVKAVRERLLETDNGEVQVSASAGVALLGQSGIGGGSDLIAAADRAMYRAKRRRSSFAVHDGPVG